MSEFLPENLTQETPGLASIPARQGDATATQDDIALMQRVFAAAAQNPTMVPEAFFQYALDFMQVNNLQIPISQVFGFSQFTVKQKASASSFGSITATSTGTGLPSADFTIDTLPDGRYVFIYGATVDISGPAAGGQIGLRAFPNKTGPNASQNAVTVVESFPIYQRSWDGSTAVTGDLSQQMIGFHVVDLVNVKHANTNNTMTLEAWLNSGSPTNLISRPFILGLRYANL